MSLPLIRASIDLGTNTCLMLIAEMAPDGCISRVISDHSTIVRLGQEVDKTRRLHPDAMERTLVCLRDYAEMLRKAGGSPGDTVCVSTATARDAQNGGEFFAKVENETGFRFRVISGDEEARFTFLGALLPDMNPVTAAVIDIGGGSTELIAQAGGKSLDLGSVRFTERFFQHDPVTDAEFWACQDEVDRMLESMRSWRQALPPGTELVAVAGTATTLAAWQLGLTQFDARQIDTVMLTRGDIHRMVEELKWRTQEERRGLAGMEPKRADVILAGALILWRALEVLGFPSVRVSTRGLRFGVLSTPVSRQTG